LLKNNDVAFEKLLLIATISAKRIRYRLTCELTSMEQKIHKELVVLGIVAEDTNDGRVGELLIPNID
jgi:hypothetical protein